MINSLRAMELLSSASMLSTGSMASSPMTPFWLGVFNPWLAQVYTVFVALLVGRGTTQDTVGTKQNRMETLLSYAQDGAIDVRAVTTNFTLFLKIWRAAAASTGDTCGFCRPGSQGVALLAVTQRCWCWILLLVRLAPAGSWPLLGPGDGSTKFFHSPDPGALSISARTINGLEIVILFFTKFDSSSWPPALCRSLYYAPSHVFCAQALLYCFRLSGR